MKSDFLSQQENPEQDKRQAAGLVCRENWQKVELTVAKTLTNC